MAGKSGKRNNRSRSNRRGPRSRRPGRKLNQAVGMRLVRANVPADPPVRSLTHEHAAIVRIDCVSGSQTAISNHGSFSSSAQASIEKGKALSVSFSDVANLIIGYMGYTSDTSFEINIRKVSVWGSRRTTETTDFAPKLVVDISDISGGLIVTDRGAPNARPRMAISSPFNLWVKPDTTQFMRFYPEDPATVGQVGIIDISVAWRRFAL